MLESDASKRKLELESGDSKKLKPSSPSQHVAAASAAELHSGNGAAHTSDCSFPLPHHSEGAAAEQSLEEDGAFNEEGEEVLSELEEEEDEEEDDDVDSDDDEEEYDDDEDSEDGVEDGEGSFQDRKETQDEKGKRKGKGAVVYEGKGKGKVEEDDDSEVEDTCEDERDEEEGDLVEDPLQEVDLSNILASRTRRKRFQPVHFDVKESSSDEDDDYVPT